MPRFRNISIICVSLILFARGYAGQFPVPQIPFAPKHYICYRTDQKLIIDGRMDEHIWRKVPWSDRFVDIEGPLKPLPSLDTQVKMLWDDENLYVAARLEEPHVWARLQQRDTVIFYDNDFEIFIDPDGDTHEYYEYEVNAFGTEWDLLLTKPYRDGNCAINAWDIAGLQTGVWVDGTLNNPADTDRGWQVEVAIPWKVLRECAHRESPPEAGEQWRINFSRVEWRTEIKNNSYVKTINPETGKPYPENNWVWSPQGIIAMHYPEMWGFVQFSGKTAGKGSDEFVWRAEEDAKWALREIYYAEKNYMLEHGSFTDRLEDLQPGEIQLSGYSWPPQLQTTDSFFEARLRSDDGTESWLISQDGKIIKQIHKKE